MKHHHQKGFTLVELAIVLVIIGLIVGGVLVGQDLIRAAELRQIMTDIEKYQTVVNTFRTKYNAIPGDMRNATSVWTAADANPEDCMAALAGVGATCNGNGDGRIDMDGGAGEALLFWQHLGNAQLIEHSFVMGSMDTVLAPNKAFGFHYLATYAGTVSGDDDFFDGNYAHVIVTYNTVDDDMAAMAPIDIKWIDDKKDDGKPGSGQVRSVRSDSILYPARCSTTADGATALYDLSNAAPNCPMVNTNIF